MSGSFSVALTLAVLVNCPAIWGVTVMFTIAPAAFAIDPRLHVTVVVPTQVPWVGIAETKFMPGGRASVTVTFVAGDGPLFVTTMR